jgi:hypothetical protein
VVARNAHRDDGRTRLGIRGAAEVRVAATLAILGLDGMAFLRTGDVGESVLTQAVGEEALKIMRARDKALAIEIANAVARLFK